MGEAGGVFILARRANHWLFSQVWYSGQFGLLPRRNNYDAHKVFVFVTANPKAPPLLAQPLREVQS